MFGHTCTITFSPTHSEIWSFNEHLMSLQYQIFKKKGCFANIWSPRIFLLFTLSSLDSLLAMCDYVEDISFYCSRTYLEAGMQER